jgi:hypothetical protein
VVDEWQDPHQESGKQGEVMFDLVEGSWSDEKARTPLYVWQKAKLVRLNLAVNLFKRYVLGSEHVAGQPQVDEMLKSERANRLFELIDVRTWESWFDQSTPTPKVKTIRALDQVAQESIRLTYAREDSEHCLAPRFFEELVHGGLMAVMAGTAKSKRIRATLCAAVDQYRPVSAWHLHMDAIEVAGMSQGIGGLPWTEVKELAAKRLMSFLHILWSPRGGAIYKLFASDLRLEWNAASEVDQARIRDDHRMYPMWFFSSRLEAAREPAWALIGVDGDLPEVHIHKALLAMAADPGFLVAERRHAWAFDLASSALAMHSLAWTDRYKTFGARLQGERICWLTLSATFFATRERALDTRNLKATMNYLNLPWTDEMAHRFDAARSSYLNEIGDLGLDLPSLVAVARHATDVHPLLYAGA